MSVGFGMNEVTFVSTVEFVKKASNIDIVVVVSKLFSVEKTFVDNIFFVVVSDTAVVATLELVDIVDGVKNTSKIDKVVFVSFSLGSSVF